MRGPLRKGAAASARFILHPQRLWIPAYAGMTAEDATSGGGWRGDVPPLFLTAAATLAISLRIPVRRGARARGVADAGRGTVLRQVSHACRREAARCKTRCPPKRTVREEPSGSSHRHTRAGRLLAPSLDLTPSGTHAAGTMTLGCSTSHNFDSLPQSGSRAHISPWSIFDLRPRHDTKRVDPLRTPEETA